MKTILTLIVCIIYGHIGNSQFINNTKFEWNKPTETVIYDSSIKKLYLKVEIDPVLGNATKAYFTDLMSEAIFKARLKKETTGTIKMYIVFDDKNPVYLDKIGTLGFAITISQQVLISKAIKKLGVHTLGSTKGVIQNSLGIIYLDIQDGRLIKARNINFNFAH